MLKRLALFLLALVLAVSPALADKSFTIAPVVTRSATGTGSAIDVSGTRTLYIHLNVSGGTGTVSVFRVFIEGSADGTNYAEMLCDRVFETGAAAPGAVTAQNQRDIINKVAVQTSLQAVCEMERFPSTVRAQWVITGTTPTETFGITATGK